MCVFTQTGKDKTYRHTPAPLALPFNNGLWLAAPFTIPLPQVTEAEYKAYRQAPAPLALPFSDRLP